VTLCAVSVDLDEVHQYERIHDVASGGPARHAVYDVALTRAGELADRHGIPLTFFAVGQDLSRPASRAALRGLCRAGHLVENHSLRHPYDLTRLPCAEIYREVSGGADAIEAAVGRRPIGFRAPGYVVSDALFDVLEELGIEFDSSVMSSPPYFGVKALVRAAHRVRGRQSASVQDGLGVLRAPRQPYRPGRPYFRRGSRRLVELPIQVTPRLGVPLIGTSFALLGRRISRWLVSRAGGSPLWNLELHGIDFLSARDGLSHLSKVQPDVAISLADKQTTLDVVLRKLADDGVEFVTLADAARRLGAAL